MKRAVRFGIVCLCLAAAGGCSKKKDKKDDAKGEGSAVRAGSDTASARKLALPAPRRFSSDRSGSEELEGRADALAQRLERRRDRSVWRDDPERQAERQKRREEMMAIYDKDGDGALDEQERAEMRTMRIDERMTRLDTDGDGMISREEAEKDDGDRGPGGLRGFDRIDANGDGKISREELENRPRRERRRFRNWREAGP